MKYRDLGRDGLNVSEFCLGTMTWGSQNTPEEAFSQIDLALERGINLIDTAEMYPTTPLRAETVGETERIIGRWLSASGGRDRLAIATKITGEGSSVIDRGGAPISPAALRQALEGSLRRLGTDHVDLYQLHWPNRGSYHFRKHWNFAPETQGGGVEEDMLAILRTIRELRDEGKLRHFGLSNESAWGTATFLKLAERENLPRVVSVQNEYNLMCRLYDLDLAELSHHENVGLLAYSPLAAGLLTGKYAGGARPDGSREAVNRNNLGGRISKFSEPVAEEYVGLAREHGLDPARMALAFCASRPFMGSVILGATTLEQLETDIAAAELTLPEAVLAGIAAIHRRFPVPM
ncbi:aldo/keto reductase [Amaricoccus solimangrovi]|uniref:Aldo/keto reductase n=1 Tax=Amaricoccus solimangrovi TaxID=2589815 RepID=A0A501WLY6_9RHOB|nr:aldo/keto reductase [Amaricoccus solimangrovi]TPE50803.1 aldo/keto reductase [Amaricoccus solimangrovi]